MVLRPGQQDKSVAGYATGRTPRNLSRVLVGTSRKSFIGKLTGKENPAERIFGTAATVALCVAAGVSIVRAHNVAEMVDVVKVANKLKIQS